VLFQGSPDRDEVCLTFDDGPDPRWTPMVLDMLAELGASATFFVLGEAVAAHPDLVARQAETGHEVGVHNWVHTDVYGVEVDALRDSVDRTITAIQNAGAPQPALWRPPYGRVDAPALMVAAERDLDILLWSEHTPTAQLARDVAETAHAGRGRPGAEHCRAGMWSFRPVAPVSLSIRCGMWATALRDARGSLRRAPPQSAVRE